MTSLAALFILPGRVPARPSRSLQPLGPTQFILKLYFESSSFCGETREDGFGCRVLGSLSGTTSSPSPSAHF